MATSHVVAERFEIERLAASGGMGAVYRARDRLTGAPVALKLLAKTSSRWAERFRLEARVLAELAHPTIVRYIAHGVTPACQPYLVMDWLDGEPLSTRLQRERLTVSEACALGIRIADALAFTHRAGVIHRDLKPGNVFLVDGDPRSAMLLDFGVARLSTQQSDATRTGDRVGTPRYMAPEQVRGTRSLDARCDLWSFGCLLHAALTGQPPFTAPDEMALWGRILLDDAPPLSVARPDTPPKLVALVSRLLEKEPAQRPSSADEVAAELRGVGPLPPRDSTDPTAVGLTLGVSGERRWITVVMVGADSVPPAFDEPFAAPASHGELAALARRHGGTFEPLPHGAIVVFAGSPAATDLVARAARCALDVRTACDAPIALASGRVNASNLAVGEAIERAAELLRRADTAMSVERTIAIDDVSATLLGERFEFVGGALRGEHLDDGVRTIFGRVTPTVGRERELNLLRQTCHDSANVPAAAAIVVVGDAGVGKSRLRHELVGRVGGGACVWVGRGDPVRAGSPLSLLGSALRRRLGVEDVSTPAARTAAWRRLQVTAEELGLAEPDRVTMFLAELIGAPVPEAQAVQLIAARRQPRLMNDQLRRAFLEWCAAELARGPVVWAFDDLHWGDAPSIELVDDALRTFADLPLCAIGFARPEVESLFPRLWAQRGAIQVQLGPLPPKAALRLIEAVMGDDVSFSTAAVLVDRAGGNAFFLEELLRAAAAGDVERIPETVVAMVQVRLEALAAPARQVLRAAAVLGTRFATAPLSALLGAEFPVREIDQILAELVAKELLVAEDIDHRELSFRHDTIREAAYAALFDGARRAAHRTAGLWLETQNDHDALTVAQHLEAGGEPQRAARWYRHAAEHALDAGDPRAVLDRAARGLECGATDHERAALLLLAGLAHDWLGETTPAERCALGAMDAASEGSPVWLRAAAELARVAGRLGNHPLLISVARDVARGGAGEAGREWVVALSMVASELLLVGHFVHARRLLELIEEQRDAWSADAVAAMWRLRVRAVAAQVDGDSVEAVALMRASTEQMKVIGARRDLASGLSNIAFLEIGIGRSDSAAESLRRATALATELGEVRIITLARMNGALALLYNGHPQDALVAAREAEDRARAHDSIRLASAALVYQARALLALGRVDDAAVAARRACVDAPAALPILAYAHAAAAAAALAANDVPAATVAASSAARLLEQLGATVEGDAYIRLTIARVWRATGEVGEARRVVTNAIERIAVSAYRLADADARARFSAVPEHAALIELHAELSATLGESGA